MENEPISSASDAHSPSGEKKEARDDGLRLDYRDRGHGVDADQSATAASVTLFRSALAEV